MRIRNVLRVFGLMVICLLTVPIMGAGNDCPKACVAVDLACEESCGGGLTGKCFVVNAATGELDCGPGGPPLSTPSPDAVGD